MKNLSITELNLNEVNEVGGGDGGWWKIASCTVVCGAAVLAGSFVDFKTCMAVCMAGSGVLTE